MFVVLPRPQYVGFSTIGQYKLTNTFSLEAASIGYCLKACGIEGFVCTRFGGLTEDRCRQALAAWRAVRAVNASKKKKANTLSFANFGAKIAAFANAQHLAHLPEPPCPERLTLWYYQMCNNLEERRAHPHSQWVGDTLHAVQHCTDCAANQATTTSKKGICVFALSISITPCTKRQTRAILQTVKRNPNPKVLFKILF